MSERGDVWWEAADYAASCAGVGERMVRDRGVSPERAAFIRAVFKLLEHSDRDALYAVVNADYATPAAQAVAQMVRMRAEAEGGLRDEPTDPCLDIIIPPEAFREDS